MITSEMLDLKNGDQVVYNGSRNVLGTYPKAGTVLTRHPAWLDDSHTVQFTWVDSDGFNSHFFNCEQIEFIKE